MDPSVVSALLFGLGPVLAIVAALLLLARFIRQRSEKAAQRRHRRHGYNGYVSYNPSADRSYLKSSPPGEISGKTSPQGASEPGETPPAP